MTLKLKHIRITHPFTNTNALWMSVVGCLVFSGILLLGNLYNDEHILSTRFHVVWQVVLNMVLLWVLFVFNFSVMKRDWKRSKSLLIAGLGSLIISLGCSTAAQGVHIWIYHENLVSGYFFFDLIKDLILALTAFLISVLLSNLTQRQQMELENEHLRAENLLIQYQSLENQVDPHFLFNSLNTLDGLIGMDDQAAHKYLHQLSDSYRYIMRQSKDVTLREELDFAQAYFSMMEIRYGANLRIEQHINEKCLSLKVVPISLQLLIENAIKHNVISDRHPLLITIQTDDSNNLSVCNHLQPKNSESQGEGIGLDNLNQRYTLLFGQGITISRTDTEFKVTIPLVERSLPLL